VAWECWRPASRFLGITPPGRHRSRAKLWHTICSKTGMARKSIILKTSPDARGPVAVSNRQPMPPRPALYLAQLRAHHFKVLPIRPRLQIAIQVEEQPQAPCVVKIIHIGSI